mgnify:CR=1 FL=1
MMQLEGLFYTAGTLLVSLGLGSLAGYGVFLYAKADGMLNITVYHYPVVPAVALAVTVAVIQLLLTYAVARSFRRMSLIDGSGTPTDHWGRGIFENPRPQWRFSILCGKISA